MGSIDPMPTSMVPGQDGILREAARGADGVPDGGRPSMTAFDPRQTLLILLRRRTCFSPRRQKACQAVTYYPREWSCGPASEFCFVGEQVACE